MLLKQELIMHWFVTILSIGVIRQTKQKYIEFIEFRNTYQYYIHTVIMMTEMVKMASL